MINEKDIENWFNQHHKMMLNIAYKIVIDKDATQDIVQDVFLKIWKRKDMMNPGELTKSYLFRSTVNMSLDYLKKNKRLSLNQSDIFDQLSAKSEGPDEKMSYNQLQERIEYAIELLPPKCKTIFVLSRYEELKYKEIAAVLNISQKTVENQMGIALKKLRLELKLYLPKEFLTLAFVCGLGELTYYLPMII